MIDGGYMNDKNIFYKKNVSLSILIIFVGLMFVGGTYAVLIMTASVNVSNGNYSTTLECFDIDYDNGGSITGILVPSSTYNGGLYGSLSLGINSNCNVNGIGNLKLYVGGLNDNSSVLISSVIDHCENIATLQTIVDTNGNLIDEDTCNSNSSYKWETNGSALKYAVLVNSSVVSVGYIDEDDVNFNIYNEFSVSEAVDYTVYIWLDGNLSDNTYSHLSFSGVISSSIVQVETAS